MTSVDEKKTDAPTTAGGAKSKIRMRAQAKAAKRSAKAADRREKATAAGVGDSRSARLRLAVLGAPRRVVGLVRDPRRLLVTLTVVGVVLAALLVTLVYFTHRHDESEAAGQEAQRVGGEKVVALLSYDYHTVRQDLPPVLDSLTGPFKDEYGRLLNTAVITVTAVIISLVVGFFGSLAIARFRFLGRRIFVLVILIVQMIPLVALTIPLSLLLDGFHLKNSLAGVIIAYLIFAMPYTVWTLCAFIAGIPKELDEAAMVDGCTRWGTFFRVILPLTGPGLVATGVYC